MIPHEEPNEEPWCAEMYYNSTSYSDGISAAGKAKRTAGAKLLMLKQFVSLIMNRFRGMIENMALIRTRYGNTEFGEEVRECGRIAELFYLSRGNAGRKRERAAAFCQFVDIIDGEMQQQNVTEIMLKGGGQDSHVA